MFFVKLFSENTMTVAIEKKNDSMSRSRSIITVYSYKFLVRKGELLPFHQKFLTKFQNPLDKTFLTM